LHLHVPGALQLVYKLNTVFLLKCTDAAASGMSRSSSCIFVTHPRVCMHAFAFEIFTVLESAFINVKLIAILAASSPPCSLWYPQAPSRPLCYSRSS
jgi:hypothetical protein